MDMSLKDLTSSAQFRPTLSNGQGPIVMVDVPNRLLHYEDGSLLPITTFIDYDGDKVDNPELGDTAVIVAGPTSIGQWLTYEVSRSDKLTPKLQ